MKIATNDPYVIYGVYWYPAENITELLYLGCCPAKLLHKLPDAHQNSVIRQLKQTMHVTVAYGTVYASQEEATEAHATMLAGLTPQPIANATGETVQAAQRGVACPVVNEDTGETYVSAYAAAQALGVTPSAVSQYLSRRDSGHVGHIAGTTLRRLT